MKHLQSVQKTMMDNFIEVDGNRVTFTIQDAPINEIGRISGTQMASMLIFAKGVFEGLNRDFPCVENLVTIEYIDRAIEWQNRRTKDRIDRGVEGFNLE